MKWPSVSERRCSGTLGMEWDSKRISKRNSGTASRELGVSQFITTSSVSDSNTSQLGSPPLWLEMVREVSRLEWPTCRMHVLSPGSIMFIRTSRNTRTSQRRWEWQGEVNVTKQEWTELEWDRWTGPVPVHFQVVGFTSHPGSWYVPSFPSLLSPHTFTLTNAVSGVRRWERVEEGEER